MLEAAEAVARKPALVQVELEAGVPEAQPPVREVPVRSISVLEAEAEA